jgi:ubiquitin carboxyl-terminal hydrolase 5/13
MASVLQSVFSLPAFTQRYYLNFASHPYICPKTDPSSCFECQMCKMADGLLSGRYAIPRSADTLTQPSPGKDEAEGEKHKPFQEGIKPHMFKALVGKDHEEFKTMRQQDADEFLRHLLSLVERNAKEGKNRRVLKLACRFRSRIVLILETEARAAT